MPAAHTRPAGLIVRPDDALRDAIPPHPHLDLRRNRHLADERLVGHAIIRILMIGRDAALIAEEQVDPAMRAIWEAAERAVPYAEGD